MAVNAGRGAAPALSFEGREGEQAAVEFLRGDYHAAARSAADSWQKYASLAMLGLAGPAIAGLTRHEGAWPCFYRAAALWIDGRDAAALEILRTIDLPAASALARMIGKRRIKVLGQLPYLRYGSQIVLEGIAADPKFQVINHSFNPKDRPSRPSASVFDWFAADDPPDFYICSMLEWHIPPADIDAAPFPILAQTADTDLHSQLLRRWLPAFDALLVSDSSEHAMVSRLLPQGVAVAAPSPFGWRRERGIPPVYGRDRPIDVFMSGLMLRPFFPDKARLLVKLLGEKGLKVLVVDGALERPKYLELMSRSKVALCYTRNQTAMVTRGIEALAMGSIAVIPAGNVIKLWAPEHSAFEYAPDFHDAAERVRAAVEAFGSTEPRERARYARAAFDQRRAASIFMRALAVRAALTAAQTRNGRRHDALRDARRNSQFIMWPIPYAAVANNAFAHNVRSFRARLKTEWTAEAANNLAREFILQSADAVRLRAENRRLPGLRYALRVLGMAIAREPRRLVLWFNYIRAGQFLGDEGLRAKAKARLVEALGKDQAFWKVSVHDDILPPDYFDNLLDRFSYLELLARVPVGQDAEDAGVEEDLKRCLLGSLHWLAGWVFDDERRFASAYRLHPAYGTIALDFAIAQLRSPAAPSDEAIRALRGAASASCLFAHAARIVDGSAVRLRGRLDQREIETARHLAKTLDRNVVPLEPTNFMRGTGRFVCFGSSAAEPRAGRRINGKSVGLVVCEFGPDAFASQQQLDSFEALPFASLTRVSPLHHPGLAPRLPDWRYIVGNTLNVERSTLLERAIAELQTDGVLVLYDAHASPNGIDPQAIVRLGGRAARVIASSGGARPPILGFTCARSTFLRLGPSARVPAAEGMFDPYDIVRRLRACGASHQFVGEDGCPVQQPDLPGRSSQLEGGKRILHETLSRESWTAFPARRLGQNAVRSLTACWSTAGRTARSITCRIHGLAGRAKTGLSVADITALFDRGWYLARYADVAASGEDPLDHFIRIGAQERRDPHPLFDTDWYVSQHPVADAANPLEHFLRRGGFEGLDPNEWFDTDWYASQYPSVAALGHNPLLHFVRRGADRGLKPCPAFDTEWYRGQYPEAVAAGKNPLAHYVREGAARGFHPNPRQFELAREGFLL